MKKTLTLMLLAVFALAIISSGCFSKRARATNVQKAETKGNSDGEYGAREEIRQSFTFTPTTRVEVVGINGSVDVATTDGDKAEVHILRLAQDKAIFEKVQALISYEENKLFIRGNRKQREVGIWDMVTGNDDLRTRVTLKLPRKLEEFKVRGVNGPVNVGELECRVEAGGINGKLVLAKAVGPVEFGGINGKIEATLAQLDKDGVSIHGVNGNVDLKFLDEVNAEIEMHGSNGRVNADLPNVKVTEQKHGRYRAIVGNGGPSIEVNGTNGNIWLSRAGAVATANKAAEPAAPATPKTVEKKLEKIASKF